MDANLVKEIVAFRDARDWAQFHTPYNLAVSIAIESAELMEIFQWSDSMEPGELCPDDHAAVADEIADILIYAATLAHDLQIDTDAAVRAKLVLNDERYPVELASGRSDKYHAYKGG